MVRTNSRLFSRGRRYLGCSQRKPHLFHLRGCHLLWPAFPDHSTKILIFDLPTVPYHRQTKPYDTTATTHTGLTSLWFRLFPFRSPLLGESRLISIPAGTEMFHFPAWASRFLWIQKRIGGIHRLGFPIRTSSDHGLLAASRGLSQLATSFIAC